MKIPLPALLFTLLALAGCKNIEPSNPNFPIVETQDSSLIDSSALTSGETLKPDPQPITTGKDSIPTIQVNPKPIIEHTISAPKKPIIYLYPEQTTDISIRLNLPNGKLTHTYPKYNPQTGWLVSAKPDGSLFCKQTEKEYYALYWEGQLDHNFAQPQEGFVVKGSESAAFLNEKLDLLGLNRREANEFILFWLPQLEQNPYNLIHFAQQSYTEEAVLNIQPKPETLIRVFMLYKALESPISINLQELKPIERKGFTVVEWGGDQLARKAQ